MSYILDNTMVEYVGDPALEHLFENGGVCASLEEEAPEQAPTNTPRDPATLANEKGSVQKLIDKAQGEYDSLGEKLKSLEAAGENKDEKAIEAVKKQMQAAATAKEKYEGVLKTTGTRDMKEQSQVLENIEKEWESSVKEAKGSMIGRAGKWIMRNKGKSALIGIGAAGTGYVGHKLMSGGNNNQQQQQ